MKRSFSLIISAILIGLIFLGACSNSVAYPQVEQFNGQDISLDWERISNPGWEPSELEARVFEFAEKYKDATGQCVCWDMALGLQQLLEENGIASIIAVSKTWTESWGKASLVLSHVWLIVFGKDGLVIPIEYSLPRLPEESRYSELLTGYFYSTSEEFEAEYPELFSPYS